MSDICKEMADKIYKLKESSNFFDDFIKEMDTWKDLIHLELDIYVAVFHNILKEDIEKLKIEQRVEILAKLSEYGIKSLSKIRRL